MTPEKIIIIGAGMAGLSACHKLMEYGFSVTILEARDRIGGRIVTNHALGMPIGGGASWIHGIDGNPVAALANLCNVRMTTMDQEQFCYYDHQGNFISVQEKENFNQRFDGWLEQARQLAYQSEKDISLAQALTAIIPFAQLSAREKALFETKLMYFEGYIGEDYELLSARHWDAEQPWPGKNCFLIDSYEPIINYLKQDCDIQLNQVVKEINVSSDQVEIKTQDSSFHADAVLVTVPLGVLKNNDIQFNPPLPDDKQQAIHRTAMGVLNVTAIKFPHGFWPKKSQAFFYTQFDYLSVPFFFNLHSFAEQPILMGYSGGQRARELEKFSDDELMEKILRNFRMVYGDHLAEPDAFMNTRWASDPFSRGSYSYLPVGASSEDMDALAKPVGDRLFFAGEATHAKHPATTHGALLSGIREAEKIRNFL